MLFAVRCLSSVVCHLSVVDSWLLLFGACCVLFVVCCMLFVVCVLCVVCCLIGMWWLLFVCVAHCSSCVAVC